MERERVCEGGGGGGGEGRGYYSVRFYVTLDTDVG